MREHVLRLSLRGVILKSRAGEDWLLQLDGQVHTGLARLGLVRAGFILLVPFDVGPAIDSAAVRRRGLSSTLPSNTPF